MPAERAATGGPVCYRFLCQQIPLPSLRASPAFRPQAQGERERERDRNRERERENEREREREKQRETCRHKVLDYKSLWRAMQSCKIRRTLAAWRNGSASDSRSEGWELESLCCHHMCGYCDDLQARVPRQPDGVGRPASRGNVWRCRRILQASRPTAPCIAGVAAGVAASED